MVGADGSTAIELSAKEFDFTVNVVVPLRLVSRGDFTVIVAVLSATPGTLVNVT